MGIVKMVTRNSGAYPRYPKKHTYAQRGLVYIHPSISISMERTINYYLVESSDYERINRIWDWCQYSGRDIPMYKTRIAKSTTGWVVECPTDRIQTAFLLNFSQWVTHISAPYYA